MKKSKYFISTQMDDFVLYYNLVNDTLLKLPIDKNEGCMKCLENPNDRTSIYWTKLYADKFIIDDNYDELKEIQCRHWKTVNHVDQLDLTVICTFDCNSDCIYCYQKNLTFQHLEMSQTDFEGLRIFLSKAPQRYIHINWYGGEPLLAKEKILRLCADLDKDKKHTYSYSVSTNGSIYDEKFFRMMERYGMTNVTVSVVGIDREHSQLRPSDAYTSENVIRNIILMTRYTNVIVNLNLCKNNIERITEVFEALLGYRYSSLSFTFSRIVSYDHKPCEDIVLDVDTYMKHVIALSNWALDHRFHISDMSCFQNFGVFCGAYAKHNYVIGPSLYVYQCDRFYNPKDAFGQIVNGTLVYNQYNATENGKEEYCNDPYQIEQCRNCKILPYCNGGCDYLRKIGKDACPSEKNYLEEYLKLYYRIFYEEQ